MEKFYKVENIIRKAKIDDLYRIVEILVFTKRLNYKDIIHDEKFFYDKISIKNYIHRVQEELDTYYVYDDGRIKGVLQIINHEIETIYVDIFFENQGIGSKLMEYAISLGCDQLWCYEENMQARRFYERHNFKYYGKRKLEGGIDDTYIIMLERK